MTKKGKRTALLQRTEQIAELQRENEELKARLAAPEKADEKLRQSEERYRLLADNASDVIWVADIDLNMTYVSPSAARMLGCSMNEVMTPAVSDLLLPEPVRLRIKDFCEQVAAEPRRPSRSVRELTLETRLPLRDGSTIWVEQRIDLIRDDADRLTGIMGITREITDRREAEEELRASEARNRLLIENANQGIVVVQGEVVKFANPKLAEISGYAIKELISKPLLDLFHPDDWQTVLGYYVRRIKGEQFTQVYPIRLLDKAGKTKWVEMNAVMLNWEGNPAVLALVTDLTGRRNAEAALQASEERNRLLIDNAAEVVTVLQDGLIKFINRKSIDFSGYSPEELISKPFIELIHPDDRQMVADNYVKRLSGGEVPGVYEFRVLDKNGLTKWAAASVALLTWEGRPASLGLLSDITERKKAEEALQDSEAIYRRLFENTQTAMEVVSGETGLVVLANETTARMFGFDSADDLVGVDSLEYLLPEERDRVATQMAQALVNKDRSGATELSVRTKDGRWLWINALVTYTEHRGKTSLLISLIDLTSRKQAEDRLKSSEQKYRLLTEQTNDVIWTTDMDLRTTYMSQSVERVLGFTPEERVGVEAAKAVTPESLAHVQQLLLEQLELERRHGADPKRTVRVEMEYYRKDGSTVWLENHVSGLRDENGTLIGFHAVARDISERRKAESALRESEANYRNLFEHTLLGMEVVDGQTGKTVLANRSIARMFGFKSPADMVGTNPLDYVLPEDMEWVVNQIPQLMAEPSWDKQAVVRAKTADGRIIWATGMATPFEYEGRPAMLISLVDVTAAKEAELKLQESEEKNRLLIDNATEGIAVVQDGVLKFANRKFAESVRYSEQELVNRSFVDFIHPDDRQRVAEYYFKRTSGEEAPSSYQFKWIDREAVVHWGEASVVNLRWEGRPATLCMLSDITERWKAEQSLRERLKELRCIAGISRLGEEPELPVEDFVQGAVGMLPPAWQYPEICGARIAVDSKEFKTANYRETEWSQSADIRVDGKRFGTVTVCYLEEMPEADEGPFLKEERDLINTVADFLGHVIQHRQMEESLRASEERYRLLAENATDVIWVVDVSLKITYVSPAVTRLLGYSVEELAGHNFDTLLTPDSLALMTQVYKDDVAGEEDRPGSWKERTVEIEVLSKDGSKLWLQAAISDIRDPEGRLAGFQGACRDITKRKRAEEELQKAHAELEVRVEQRTAELEGANVLLMQEIRQRRQAQAKLQESESKYRELVESANSIILELDTKGKVTFFNRFAQEFFGFSESDILGCPVVGTIAPPIDSEGRDRKAQTRDLVKHPESYLVIENEGIRRNGERVWVSWTNKGLYDPRGKLRNVLCIGMDRTEQRRVAEMLEQQLKEKAASEERQRLARDLHDAVTQTLFSASLIGEVLPRLWKRDRAEGERRLEELRLLTRGALAEMRMLLLELRPGALGEVGLANLLRQLVEATTVQTKLHVDLAMRGECDAPAEVQVALYRVAQEALNNAVKHSGAQEAKIKLACGKGSADLTVSDNGSGFDAEAVSPESLGLRIMHERAEAVGATLKVEGWAGRGTKVKAHWSGIDRKGDS